MTKLKKKRAKKISPKGPKTRKMVECNRTTVVNWWILEYSKHISEKWNGFALSSPDLKVLHNQELPRTKQMTSI